MTSNILLESGINELEIVVFKVGDSIFAVNVAKVDSILNALPVTKIPQAHRNIKGLINYRNKVYPVVNLSNALNVECIVPEEKRLMILIQINNQDFAIEVSQVLGIKRLSWQDIKSPSALVMGRQNTSITGVVNEDEDNMILMLDLEKILSEISSSLAVKKADVLEDLNGKRIIVAEDSTFLLKVVRDTFADAGAIVEAFNNGREALEYLRKMDPESIYCVITDIEMPIMDGLTLTRNIKEDSDLKSIPVIIFSSIVSDKLKHQGISVGADDQITKPKLGELVDRILSLRK